MNDEFISNFFLSNNRWQKELWEERNVGSDMKPIFELCSNPDPAAMIYILFPEEFDFNFYNTFCQNLGGR